MRSQRLTFVFLAFYLIFIGGSAYYTLVFPIRIFHHAFMSLLMGIWYFRKFRGEGLPQTPLNRPLLAMSAVWVLSTIFGIEPRNAIEGLWFVFLHLTIFFVLTDLFQRGRGRLVIEAQFFMGAIVVLFSGIELASWYLGLGITPNTQIGWIDVGIIPLEPIRLALAMNISTLLAGYVAPLIILTIGWALTARRRDYRVALWLLAGILGIILVLTFSRGGLMSVGAGIGAFSLMRIVGNEKRATLRKWLIPLIIIGALGFVVIFTISQARNTGDEVRLDMYRSAVEILLDNPIVGVGVGNYGRAFRDYRTPEMARDHLASAHNVYLNTASETGILGVIVCIWLGGALVMTWWGVWKAQTSSARKIRQETVIAALIGVGVHSMVDVFSTTPLVVLIILLVAYSITGHQTVLSVRPQGHKFPALVACVVVVGYGIFFIQTDRAYSAYLASLRDDENALANAQLAQSLDPELNLYTLQVAYLTNTIPSYKTALQLEPTWDVGWMNLAYLYEQTGQYDKALNALLTARQINPISVASFNIGRVGEAYGGLSDEEIIDSYRLSLYLYIQMRQSDFWTKTDLRQHTLRIYLSEIQTQPVAAYRIIATHFPDELANFIPQNPQSASDWWMVGEYALSVENNPQQAYEAFSNAIRLDPRLGDYYASRARANLVLGDDVTRDVNFATLLGVEFESITLIRAEIAERDGEDETAQKLRELLSIAVTNTDFAGVLYQGRVGVFDLPAGMLLPE